MVHLLLLYLLRQEVLTKKKDYSKYSKIRLFGSVEEIYRLIQFRSLRLRVMVRLFLLYLLRQEVLTKKGDYSLFNNCYV